MGVVYEAVGLSLGRRVALKVAADAVALDPRRRAVPPRGRRPAARLHHTNIVPVFGVGEDGGCIYYAMQFIDGRSRLDAVIARLDARPAARPGRTWGDCRPTSRADGRRPAATVLAGRQTAAASTAARPERAARIGPAPRPGPRLLPDGRADRPAGGRGAGLTPTARASHRDVKPSNILIDAARDGLGRRLRPGQELEGDGTDRTGDIVGTLRYMAPERFDGRPTPAGDVYALGATLYELLALRPAFEATDRARLIEQVLREEPPRPRSIDPRIPRDLETIVLKAMAKEPSARYASAAGHGGGPPALPGRRADPGPSRSARPSGPSVVEAESGGRLGLASAFVLAVTGGLRLDLLEVERGRAPDHPRHQGGGRGRTRAGSGPPDRRRSVDRPGAPAPGPWGDDRGSHLARPRPGDPPDCTGIEATGPPEPRGLGGRVPSARTDHLRSLADRPVRDRPRRRDYPYP